MVANLSPSIGVSRRERARQRAERYRTLQRLENLSRLLDIAYRVPGTNIRFGVDALLGLLPGVGDVASGALSSYLIYEAYRLGAPKRALALMIGNVAFDTVVGSVPLVGDVFDVFWRANIRNMQILRSHLASPGKRHQSEPQSPALKL
jgi:hypothetical protein